MKLKKQEGRFLGGLLAPLSASKVYLVISSVVKVISGRGVKRAGNRLKFLFLLHLLNNIDITNYFKYEPRFNGVFSRNNLPKIEDGVYLINLDDKKK